MSRCVDVMASSSREGRVARARRTARGARVERARPAASCRVPGPCHRNGALKRSRIALALACALAAVGCDRADAAGARAAPEAHGLELREVGEGVGPWVVVLHGYG